MFNFTTRQRERNMDYMDRKKKAKWLGKDKIMNLFFYGIVFFMAVFIVIELEQIEVDTRREEVQAVVDNCANEISYQVKNVFNNTYVLNFSVRRNYGKTNDFYSIAQDIEEMYPGIAFVALAPEGTIKKMYPFNMYGEFQNEDLLTYSSTESAAKKAKESGGVIIAEPFKAGKQEKELVFGMQSIYINKANGKKFWGYAVIGIELDYITQQINAGLKNYAIKIELSKDKSGRSIYAKQEKNLINPVVSTIKMPGQDWTIAVSPENMWISLTNLILRAIIAVVVSVLVIILIRLIYRDIVRQTELQAALEEEKERYQIAMESSSDTIFEYDIKQDTCTFFGSILNGKKTDGTRMEIANFESKILTGEMFHYQDIEKAIQFFSGERTEPFETRYRFKQEEGQVRYVWLSLKGSVILENGKPIKVIGTTRNIQARKEQEWKRLEERNRDKLTNLYTEEYGRMLIEQYLTAKPKEEECEFFLIGIDHFQQMNDLYGYMFADTILVEVSEMLRGIANAGDICIRLGGDEFILFQKNSNSLKAERTAKEIIKRVGNVYAGENENVSLSCSIGRASTAVFHNYEQMLKYAHLAFSYLKDNEKGKQANYINISDEIEEMMVQSNYNERGISEIIDTNSIRDDDIISFAFGILEKTKDLKSAIYILLARIGKRYELSEIRVIESDLDYLSFRTSYRWCNRNPVGKIEKVVHLENNSLLKRVYNIFEKEGCMEVSPKMIERYEDKLSGLFQGVEGCTSLLCPMWEEGSYKGVMGYVAKEKNREWTSEEKHVFREITKIISTHISRVNADIASKAKSEFLSRMSHEIRTPMNAIIGMTNIAMSSMTNSTKVMDCLKKIDVSTKYLLSLINDILDMSRIESGKMTINNEKFHLNQLLQEIDVLIRPQAEEKKLNFTIDSNYTTSLLIGDELRLSQVLINLLGNALKFTPKGGNVTLKVQEALNEEQVSAIFFEVRDDGIGISEENKIRIFEAFEQEKTDTANKYGGTGLGLAISSNLVHLMGGNLEVESEEQKGSAFSFTLTFSTYEEEKIEISKAKEPVSLKGKQILVVEDNELNAEIAQTLLEMDECIVTIAYNGAEAVQTYEEKDAYFFDCILMDIRMPIMNGMEATRKIRTSGKADARSIPIIALSANAFDEDTQKSIECGMNGHVAKPINIDMLHEALYKVLK